eukprot:4082670-Prymnesium_polylepis.1
MSASLISSSIVNACDGFKSCEPKPGGRLRVKAAVFQGVSRFQAIRATHRIEHVGHHQELKRHGRSVAKLKLDA